MKKASDIMSKTLVTVSKDQAIEVAHNLMLEKRINHILVTSSDGSLVGILSDRDTKKIISPFIGTGRETPQDKLTLKIKVERVMKSEVITVTPDESIKACIEKILQKAIHALPVVEAGTMHLKGIITPTNILRWMLSEM